MDRVSSRDLPVHQSTTTPAMDASVIAASRTAVSGMAGLWRLGVIGIHIVRGVVTVRLHFGRLSPAQRHERIQEWAQGVLRALRIELHTRGDLLAGPKLVVANHVSWLDIVVIHAVCPHARFVSKAVVREWPLIGRLVTGAGTLMVDRNRRRDTTRALDAMVQALQKGDSVALFPEGTTSDGAQVLEFHSSLLHSAVVAQVPVQPVALRYCELGQTLSPSIPYIGTTSFVESLWRICKARQVAVTLSAQDVVAAPHVDRRALAREVRQRIVRALEHGLDDRA
jgi:1-acyl-sn-glycerol-3-phosphate acyltransferase